MGQFKLLLFSLSLVIISCENESNFQDNDGAQQKPLKYSNFFQINTFSGYKQLLVLNPWKENSVLASYILIPHHKKVPLNLNSDQKIIRTPIRRAAVLSSPYIGMMQVFNRTKEIVAVENIEYIYNPEVRAKVKEGNIKELGSAQNLNIEALIEQHPSLIITSVSLDAADSYKVAKNVNIPTIFMAEWMENTPLARAEWIKFMGALLDMEEEADSMFRVIEDNYISTKKLVDTSTSYPKVILGKKYKGTWYMAGGNSFFAQFLKDAKSNYFLQTDSSSGSLPLSFETILDSQLDADYWINPGTSKSLGSIENDDNRYAFFKAFQEKKVYNNTRMSLEDGANAYWEIGFLTPHLILSDLIKILHPNLLPNHQLVYFEQLKD